MGFFSGIKNNIRKSEASAIIESLLQNQAKLGFFPVDKVQPAEMATKLIQVVWDKNTKISMASPLPHKMALASVGLSAGILVMDKTGEREILLALKSCLGSILLELNASGHQMKLNAIDIDLISQAEGVFMHFSES